MVQDEFRMKMKHIPDSKAFKNHIGRSRASSSLSDSQWVDIGWFAGQHFDEASGWLTVSCRCSCPLRNDFFRLAFVMFCPIFVVSKSFHWVQYLLNLFAFGTFVQIPCWAAGQLPRRGDCGEICPFSFVSWGSDFFFPVKSFRSFDDRTLLVFGVSWFDRFVLSTLHRFHLPKCRP